VKDTIAKELVEKRVPLATMMRMPHHAREFIKKNYVPIAFRLFILGKVLRDKSMPPNSLCEFEIKVPARYTLVTPSGAPTGMLDDSPFTGPRELAIGKHTFTPESENGRLVLVWAQAVERGYSPFAKIKKDYKSPQD
jgi:hypothetical protein